MRARFLVIFSLILVASLVVSVTGCKHEDVGSHTAQASSKLDTEAKVEVTKVFDAMIAKCGDKYYMWDGSGGSSWYGSIGSEHEEIIEFQEKPRIDFQDTETLGDGETRPLNPPVSELDRMNGLTWSGGWTVIAPFIRELRPHKISSWKGSQPFSIGVKNLNGVWLVPQRYDHGTTVKWVPIDSFSDNVPCEKVSEYSSQEGVSRTDSQ